MTGSDFCDAIHSLKIMCGQSYRYHQRLAWWYDVADLASRVAVFCFSFADFVAALTGTNAIALTIFAFGSASVLLFLSIDGRARRHADLFRRWNALYGEADAIEKRTCDLDATADAAPAHVGALNKLQAAANEIHGEEPAAWKMLLAECYGDELQSIWGPGIRTNEQAEAERQRRQNAAS